MRNNMNSISRLKISPVLDLWPNMCINRHHGGHFRKRLELLAGLGFKRIYFVATLPGFPMFSSPWLCLYPMHNNHGHYGLESIVNAGDPNFDVIFEAHKLGMEAFAVFKPYEGGSGHTLPDGMEPEVPRNCVKQIGGIGIGYDNMIGENPELRVKRRQIPDYDRLISLPIDRLEVSFVLDEVKQRDTVFPRQPDEVISLKPFSSFNPRLWISHDNGRYEPYHGSIKIAEKLERLLFNDSSGLPVGTMPMRARTVTISGLELPGDCSYGAISYDNADSSLVTVPFTMIKAYSGTEEVPTTNGWLPRQTLVPVEPGAKKTPEDFRRQGFEFDWHGGGHYGPGWNASQVIGMARGKNLYMKGSLCEGYPEVRKYWLEQVERLIAMGVDGIDFRLQSHSAMVSDYINYGYNEPLVTRYKEKYGVDILTEEADPLKLMAVRGSYYLEFLRSAAATLKEKGRKVQIHFRNAYENPKVSFDFGELGFWAMPKVFPDWREMLELADEVTIKDYNWARYVPEKSSEIKNEAHRQNKPVWIHCYIAQGGDLNEDFCNQVAGDERISGILLYEDGHSHNPNINNIGLIKVDQEDQPVYYQTVRQALKKCLDI